MSEISVGDGILSPNAILNATNDLYTGWPKKVRLLYTTTLFLYFLLRGGTCTLRMPARRPASQAGPMHNPRDGTNVV